VDAVQYNPKLPTKDLSEEIKEKERHRGDCK
jgi:hypothetical protein